MVDEITLESIFEKEASALTEEEVQHLNEHKSQLTGEQMEKFASVLTDETGNGESEHRDNENKDGETST